MPSGSTPSGAPRRGSSRARAAAAAMAAQAERAERRRRWTWRGLGALVGAVVAVALIMAVATAQRAVKPPDTAAALATVSGTGAAVPPPWETPTDTKARVAAAGLTLGQMGTAEHYHAHLDLRVNGRTLRVPPGIGVDATSGEMSALHTHSFDGVLHVEAGRKGQPFTLGQLFTEWNVKLSATQLGSLNTTATKHLVLYVNGLKRTDDPALLRLEPDQQIALAFGTPATTADLPTAFDFTAAQ